MKSKVHQFLFHHPVFSYDEFVHAMNNPPATCRVMIAQHVKRGNIIPIKRGLYAAVPSGAEAAHFPVDPYLIINVCTPDAVIAYHSALQFHGYAHSSHFDYVFLSDRQIRSFQFRDDRFLAHAFPSALPLDDEHTLIQTVDYHGYDIKVTSIERTLVDVLDRINLSGGLEEIWRSIDLIESINIDKTISYALQLNNKTTIAKLGFYLSGKQVRLAVTNEQLDRLKEHLSVTTHYMHRGYRKHGALVKDWKLIVPEELVHGRWDEQFDIGEVL